MCGALLNSEKAPGPTGRQTLPNRFLPSYKQIMIPTAATPTPILPTYPARPISGGPLTEEATRHRSAGWLYEPKVNGWRALLHCPSGALFNRHGERLSIEREFAPVLEAARTITDPALTWLDCEAFERRHPLGRGSLVVLDAPLVPGGLDERFLHFTSALHDKVCQPWAFCHVPPPEDSLLTFAYAFETLEAQHALGFLPDDEVTPMAAWTRLQECNRQLGCELFEGLVAKRLADPYPLQTLDPKREFPFWVKHRWAW